MYAIGRQPQREPERAPVPYECHRPEQITLYHLVQRYAATFIAQTVVACRDNLPQFVKGDFDAFFDCAILAYGFLRQHCGAGREGGQLPGSQRRLQLLPAPA